MLISLITLVRSSIFYISCKPASFPVHPHHAYNHTLYRRQTSTYRHIGIQMRSIVLSSGRIFSPNRAAPSFFHPYTFFGKSETRVVFQYAEGFFSTPVHNYELPLKKLLAIQLVVSAFYSFFFELIQKSLFPQFYLILLVIVFTEIIMFIDLYLCHIVTQLPLIYIIFKTIRQSLDSNLFLLSFLFSTNAHFY